MLSTSGSRIEAMIASQAATPGMAKNRIALRNPGAGASAGRGGSLTRRSARSGAAKIAAWMSSAAVQPICP